MKSKVRTIIETAATFICLASGVGAVQAATITLDPLNPVVGNGDSFIINVVGQGFTEGSGGTIGGGFSLAWDPSILTLDSYNLTFPGDQTFGQLGTLDNTAGTLTNADVTSLSGTTDASFNIASLTFSAHNSGVSPTDISIGLFAGGSPRIWADSSGFVDTNPTFVDGTVTVNAVPVPAAVWLFGSGLIGMIGIARKRSVSHAV